MNSAKAADYIMRQENPAQKVTKVAAKAERSASQLDTIETVSQILSLAN